MPGWVSERPGLAINRHTAGKIIGGCKGELSRVIYMREGTDVRHPPVAVGLGQYADAFEREEVDLDALPDPYSSSLNRASRSAVGRKADMIR